MRPVSEKFLNSLRGSHAARTQAFVVAAGQTGVSPTGTEVTIIGGDVILDATAAIRSTLDITVDGTGAFPDSSTDSFTPYGNEIFIRKGMVFGGGSVEWVSLGYFRIHSVEQDDAPNGPIRISANDRMAGIVEARLLEVVQYPATATYGDVVEELVQEVYPWAVIDWDDVTETDPIGRSLIAESDRYAFLDDLVTSRGKIWYWDHRGVLVIKDVPDPDDPVWNVNAGADGVLVQMARDLSREGVYNAVKATGEALDTTAPPSAVAVDNNPDSPTYWYGNFGKVLREYSSPFLTTVGQAQSAANALLKQKLGLPYNVQFSSVVNPALEPYDAVAINNVGHSYRIKPRVIAQDSFSVPAAAGWVADELGSTYSMTLPVTDFVVTGGEGTYTAASGDSSLVRLLGVDEYDIEGTFVAHPPEIATGASLVYGAVVRYTAGSPSSYYAMRLEFDLAGAVTLKIAKQADGVATTLASENPLAGLVYAAGQRWIVRYRVVGKSLKMRAWIEGDSEPSSWMLTATDSRLTSGSVGFLFWRVSPNSNTTAPQFRVDDWQVKTFPGLRPDDEVHVIERLTIPLDVQTAMTADTREQTLVVIGEA